MAKVRIPYVKCKRCGYKWVPRTSDPRVCPKCHSRAWDKDKR